MYGVSGDSSRSCNDHRYAFIEISRRCASAVTGALHANVPNTLEALRRLSVFGHSPG